MPPIPTKLGRYEIVKHLANGGMAQVLIARATGIEGFERHVVVKRIHADHAADPAFVQMFLDEARTAAALHHNNIVQVHDIGKENGEYFFAMEYVHGQDLRMLLKEASRQKQKVPWEHVITIMTSAAAGLHHAHELRGSDRKPLGLVHRDVSPANILIGYDGTVKMVDFGIAKAALRTGEGTRGGALKGKVSYMAPEQCAGKPIDRRSDVYALGVVLYELSTVRRLFKSDNDFLTMSAIVAGDIPQPSAVRPDLPAPISDIILKALSKKPAERYQTADEMREALEEVANQLKLRTSTGALATYMKAMFGAQPEPWLVQEDAELELTVDFDGSASGMAQASDEVANAIPDNFDAVASAPILRARKRATGSPPNVALAATGSSGTQRPSGTGAGGTGTPPLNPAKPQTSRPVIVIPPKDGPATARTSTRTPPAGLPQTGPAIARTMTPPAVARTATPPAVARTMTPPAVARTMTPPAVARTATPPVVARTMTPPASMTAPVSIPTATPSRATAIPAATPTPASSPATPALPRTVTSARSAATIGAPPRTKNPTATPPVGVGGSRSTPLPPELAKSTPPVDAAPPAGVAAAGVNATATPPVEVGGSRSTPLPPGLAATATPRAGVAPVTATLAADVAVARTATPPAGVATKPPLPPKTPPTGVPTRRTPPPMSIAKPDANGASAAGADAIGHQPSTQHDEHDTVVEVVEDSALGGVQSVAKDASGAKADASGSVAKADASGSVAKADASGPVAKADASGPVAKADASGAAKVDANSAVAKSADASSAKADPASPDADDKPLRLPSAADDDFTIEESPSGDKTNLLTKDELASIVEAKPDKPATTVAAKPDKPTTTVAAKPDKPAKAVAAAEPVAAKPDQKKKLIIGGGVAFLVIVLIVFLAKRGGGTEHPKQPKPPDRSAVDRVKQPVVPPPTPDTTESIGSADGSATEPAGSAVTAGSATVPAGSAVHPAGSAVQPAGSAVQPAGSATEPAGSGKPNPAAGSGSAAPKKKRPPPPPKKKWNPDELFINP